MSGSFMSHQVMETDRMLYLVTEFASKGEIFGEYRNASIIASYRVTGKYIMVMDDDGDDE